MDRRLSTCALVLGLLLLLSIQGVSLYLAYPQGSEVKQAEEKLIEAFIAVKQAEKAGARKEDLAELVFKLNEALFLLEKVKKGEGEVESISRVIELSEDVIFRAKELETRASSRLLKVKVFLIFAVPIAAVITAFGLNYAYKWWHRREIERILSMVAKKREERGS